MEYRRHGVRKKFGGLDTRSGDDFIDFTFREFIYILEDIVETIKKTPNLKNPRRPQQGLWGYFHKSEIFLEARANKKILLETLIHELAHALYYSDDKRSMRERKIQRVEKILWRRFTEDQKRILSKYIPKHIVKKGPDSQN
ncbi:MAG: hypothetical protein HYT12_04710 [Candidatus Liptonbacteria bacterium]|nr:hypothetical protein [Candidatus Liptonbacteria bacterium]